MKIDKVYLINLDISKERFRKSDIQLKKLGGIFKDYKRIPGVNGNELSEEYIKSITTPYSYYFLNNTRDMHYQIDKKGAIGCSLSHIKIWNDMIENNYENIIVFEDDFIIDDFENFYKIINNVPIGAKVGYLSYSLIHNNFSWNKINDYWKTTDDIYTVTTKCYFINIELAKELLKKALPIDTHIDFYINFYCNNNNIPRYYGYKSVVENGKNISTIKHGNNINLSLITLFLNFEYIIIIILIVIIIYIKLKKQ